MLALLRSESPDRAALRSLIATPSRVVSRAAYERAVRAYLSAV